MDYLSVTQENKLAAIILHSRKDLQMFAMTGSVANKERPRCPNQFCNREERAISRAARKKEIVKFRGCSVRYTNVPFITKCWQICSMKNSP